MWIPPFGVAPKPRPSAMVLITAYRSAQRIPPFIGRTGTVVIGSISSAKNSCRQANGANGANGALVQQLAETEYKHVPGPAQGPTLVTVTPLKLDRVIQPMKYATMHMEIGENGKLVMRNVEENKQGLNFVQLSPAKHQHLQTNKTALLVSGLYGVNGYLVLQPVELEPEAEAELVQLPMNVPVTHKNKITVLTIRQNAPAPALTTAK